MNSGRYELLKWLFNESKLPLRSKEPENYAITDAKLLLEDRRLTKEEQFVNVNLFDLVTSLALLYSLFMLCFSVDLLHSLRQ